MEAILMTLSELTNLLLYYHFCCQLVWAYKWDNPAKGNTLSYYYGRFWDPQDIGKIQAYLPVYRSYLGWLYTVTSIPTMAGRLQFLLSQRLISARDCGGAQFQ